MKTDSRVLTIPALVAALLLCQAPAVLAQAADEAAIPAPDMRSCQVRWQSQAREQGLSAATVEQLIPTLQYLPKILELDRRQPEFTSTFASYLSRRVTDSRIEKGLSLRKDYARLLDNLSYQYGIPQQILLAFWGLETNYGGYLGTTETLNALATLGCDPRRSDYFSRELLIALGLVEHHKLKPENMRGSWAGAMGHTQFMPSNYKRYGRDGDGDGRIDLWNSPTDALTSAANFLEQLGWQRGARWGREIRLPANFDYSLAGLKQARPLREWQQLGLLQANGGPLPVADFDAALLVPAGHRGPAFLVYKNFRIIMRWNNSEAYALSVGLLSDRIEGKPGLVVAPPENLAKISRAQIKALQAALNDKGYDSGTPDGIAGPGTRGAIRQFQASRGMIADGYYSSDVFAALGIAPTPATSN
ncbi:MAG: lytic murein transglycosylase [Oceanococcus sp.]